MGVKVTTDAPSARLAQSIQRVDRAQQQSQNHEKVQNRRIFRSDATHRRIQQQHQPESSRLRKPERLRDPNRCEDDEAHAQRIEHCKEHTLVGGDLQGKNPEIMNAWNTRVAAGVVLTADARVKGNGGTVIVWSTGVPRCLGAGEDATGGRLKSELPGAVEIQPALA